MNRREKSLIEKWLRRALLFLLVILLFRFVIIEMIPVPFIIQDQPFDEWICDIQYSCFVSHHDRWKFNCDNTSSNDYRLLESWKYFNGCDELTKGYNGNGEIENLTVCHCP